MCVRSHDARLLILQDDFCTVERKFDCHLPCTPDLRVAIIGMPESRTAAECSILTRSILHKSSMERILPNCLDFPLKSRNRDSCGQAVQSSARSSSISPVKERITVPPALALPTLASKRSDSVPCKKKCLCAPTKHAGSFRCRLHRLPPSQTISAAARKGISQLSSSKTRLSINQRLLSTSAARLHETKTSMLSRVTIADEQKQAAVAEEAFLIMTKVPTTANSALAGSGFMK